MRKHVSTFKGWLRQHRTVLLRLGGGLVGVIILVQLFYPGDRMPLFASVDGVDVSGWSKRDAINRLDTLAAGHKVNIRLSGSSEDYGSAKPAEFGLTISNKKRIETANYPWYVRIVPTSLLWFGLAQSEKAPEYSNDAAKATEYLRKSLGESCNIPPKDASLRLKDDSLEVVHAKSGGTCQEAAAVKALTSSKPDTKKTATITIPVDVTAPNVGDSEAETLASTLNDNAKAGIKLAYADRQQTIAASEVLSWLTFKTDGDKLMYEIDANKASAYFAKTITPALTKPAGVTKVSTLDFAETSRSDGATGQTLNLTATVASVDTVLKGTAETAAATPTQLAPKVEYTRSYTKTSNGIAAQIKFYDDDNAGVFGVSFVELGGQGLSAQHNGSRQFVTASTYKLFVAFSTLKRVDAGTYKWSDANIAGGRNLSTCFDDMIVKSDNACAEALIKKIGANDLNADIRSLGLGSTAFKSSNNVTTANDLANYLTQLEKGTMPIKPESRDKLLGAMKRNVYRQGVPAGASGQVADKVGFLWGLLHDATIVYSPKGTYVLVVLTDGSTWANIADLTRKIEALR